MVDKLPPRFAPEGARFKRSDWAPEGSPADRQKRTYLDRIGDLERKIESLQSDVESRDTDLASFKRRYAEAGDELRQQDTKIAKLNADMAAFHEDRKGDAGRIEALQENLGHINDERVRLQGNLDTLKREHAELRGQFDKQTTHLADARKSVAGARTKFIAIAVLGAAGTIWGSLGNPIPWSSSKPSEASKPPKTDEEIAAERFIQQRTACVLKERKRSLSSSSPVVSGLPWLPGSPTTVIQTKDVPNPPEVRNIRLSGISINRPSTYNNRVNISGRVTNSGSKTVSSVRANLFLVGTMDNGECQPIYSQSVYADVYAPPGSSKDFTIPVDVPTGTSSFSGENGYLTDVKVDFY